MRPHKLALIVLACAAFWAAAILGVRACSAAGAVATSTIPDAELGTDLEWVQYRAITILESNFADCERRRVKIGGESRVCEARLGGCEKKLALCSGPVLAALAPPAAAESSGTSPVMLIGIGLTGAGIGFGLAAPGFPAPEQRTVGLAVAGGVAALGLVLILGDQIGGLIGGLF